ncbi:uncharacterized protein L3040_001052 [Drepanopeziza brunnea f. sp. 'multigermtubi']|uniref:uncharacterized protein n=1 Tax=Drepanopeziza brunnea f. sp. 'multigermtubi' TaxID=698441 RepID=UPI00238C166D|nr:hypothetical protein L3040_001052 [Drepanopeziza brunnea f. sp. 'multigermtubi']
MLWGNVPARFCLCDGAFIDYLASPHASVSGRFRRVASLPRQAPAPQENARREENAGIGGNNLLRNFKFLRLQSLPPTALNVSSLRV